MFIQIRIWSRPEMFDQTSYALSFAEKAYQFFAEYFGMPEVVPKAGRYNYIGNKGMHQWWL